MAKKNNDRVSIANVLSLLGLAGLGVISFYGMLLGSADGKPGGPILGAVALVVGLGLLLLLSIKAKGANDNRDKWRIVEYVALAIYVVVALLCAGPFLRFFFVTSQSDSLQQQGRAEVAAIEAIYKSYEKQCDNHLKMAVQEIKNYKASPQFGTDKDEEGTLKHYVAENCSNEDSWAAKAESVVMLDSISIWKRLGKLKTMLDNMSIMQLNELANELEYIDTNAVPELEEKIKQYEQNHLIPVVTGGEGKPYALKEKYASFTFDAAPEPLFAQTLRQASGSTVLGWILLVVLHVLVLVSYIVAPKSSVVGPKRSKEGLGSGREL